jgi:hypothetical protein
VKALEAATALRVWQGTSQAPATGSQGVPMVFWSEMAAASAA